jgi:hypothetical protein
MGIAARAPPSNKLSPAAIAGVVLGSLAVVALLVIAGVLVYFVWQKRSKRPRHRKPSKTDITPFPSDTTSQSNPSRHSRRTFDGRELYSQGAGLLDGSASTPGSPDWATTLLSEGRYSNTFAGGTTFNDGTRSSNHGYYRTADNSSASLINLDSPPPYPIPHSPLSVPLVPLRKTRRS